VKTRYISERLRRIDNWKSLMEPITPGSRLNFKAIQNDRNSQPYLFYCFPCQRLGSYWEANAPST
jgi:hypothetical protein